MAVIAHGFATACVNEIEQYDVCADKLWSHTLNAINEGSGLVFVPFQSVFHAAPRLRSDAAL
eukprot:TRINITY_DN7948_c0_g1_i1.p4 TRINITY_DN7948_c0_g1~~TRINITY_DN7948_c0_g1_i1.p4  ORF type:complete len:62 (+),score=2.37 TRINITY_DN7948_c0_g1_i1:94-279(+)